uniref:Uncharacterized protein n=1 Tax=Anguilla anguilla TaxID=7936 RepID=A0A0E9TZ29_ANGAN
MRSPPRWFLQIITVDWLICDFSNGFNFVFLFVRHKVFKKFFFSFYWWTGFC